MRRYPPVGDDFDPYTEHLVVLQLLGETRGVSRAKIGAELDDIDSEWIDNAIRNLEREGVVVTKRTRVHLTAPARRVDDLDMICI